MIVTRYNAYLRDSAGVTESTRLYRYLACYSPRESDSTRPRCCWASSTGAPGKDKGCESNYHVLSIMQKIIVRENYRDRFTHALLSQCGRGLAYRNEPYKV